MGSCDTMTVSSVAPLGPPVTKLPASTRRSGRPHRCPFEIELGLLERGFRRGDLPGGVALRRLARIEFPSGQRLVLDQRGGALDIQARDLELGVGALDVGFGLLDRKPVGARIANQ